MKPHVWGYGLNFPNYKLLVTPAQVMASSALGWLWHLAQQLGQLWWESKRQLQSGVTKSWGLPSHAQNAFRRLALFKWLVEAPQKYHPFIRLSFEDHCYKWLHVRNRHMLSMHKRVHACTEVLEVWQLKLPFFNLCLNMQNFGYTRTYYIGLCTWNFHVKYMNFIYVCWFMGKILDVPRYNTIAYWI